MRRIRPWAVVTTIGVALLCGCDSDKSPTCSCPPISPAIVTTFAKESVFVSQVAPIGPLNAPYSDRADVIVVGDDRFSIKPGDGVDKIAVSNIIGNSLLRDMAVACECYSNLDFAFRSPVAGFGFGVASWTAATYGGSSAFVITLYHEGTQVGSAQFSAPAEGESFFALLSSVRFDALTLRETGGGPQEGPVGAGGVDRESFGNFYVVP